jgi:adenylate cyclase
MSVPTEQRRLAAIMFTDIVGYGAIAQRNDSLALELLEEHRQILRRIFEQFRGEEIKTIGDAFMVEFASALDAANCAIEIQRTLAKRNHDVPSERQIEVRIGVHIGDVVHRDNDVYGDGVNIASRIQPLARPGSICVSMDVERQIRNSLEARLEKLSPVELKNVQIPMDLFRIALPWEKRASVSNVSRNKPASLALGTAVVLLLALAAMWMWSQHSTARAPASIPLKAPNAKSVAVLPFVNMSSDKENEYLSDGITEDLCTALTQIKGLHVPAHTSSFAFKGKTEDIRKIGEQLNVGTVLEGSVSKAGNKLRISAQLINVADGFHLWAANYDREMTDILEIRSDISRQVVDALKVQLGIEETQRLVRKPTETPEAYETYLLGRYELNKFTEPGFRKAVEHFKHAIEIDHSFALANAGLAEAYNMLAYWNYVAPTVGFPEAKRAAERALEVDPELAEGHSALGFVLYEYEWRFAEAEHEFREAIRLNPSSVAAHFYFLEFLLAMEKFQEAEEQLAVVRKLDPLSVRVSFDLAVKFFFERKIELAVDQLEKTIAMEPNNDLTCDFLGQVFWKANKPARAVEFFEKANILKGNFSEQELTEMRKAYAASGLSAYLRKQCEVMQLYLAGGKYQSPLRIAMAYAAAGDDGETLRWLEKAAEEHTPWLPELKVEPTWDAVRSDPRFIAILKKMGLEK